eukprot:4413948-Prymnesium_polylepis.1
MAETTAALLAEVARTFEAAGRTPRFSLWGVSTLAQPLAGCGMPGGAAGGVPLAEALRALRALRYDGGTDLSLLDGVLSDVLSGGGAGGAPCEAAVLVSDGVDNLPGKRRPTLQLAGGGACPPLFVPLPPPGHNANLSTLRWLAYQTGGRTLPVGSAPQRAGFAAAVAG